MTADDSNRAPDCAHPEGRRKALFPAKDYISGDAFEIVHCGNCGAVITSPTPPPHQLARYYPTAYYRTSGGRRFPGPVEFLQRRLYAGRARTVERLLGRRGGKVIDVGCGPGWLLRAFQQRGWKAKGTELSEPAAAFARNELGLDVESRELTDLNLPDGSFDSATLWHVLEHIPQPERMLREIARILKPGGVLLVGVPNWGSPESRMSRDKWFQLDVPRHVNHFTAPRLRKELADAGFDVRVQRFLAPEFDFFSFVQTVLNRLGFRQNLLYNLLRRREAKLANGKKAGWGQTTITLLVAPLLGALSIPVTLTAALLGLGGSMTFYAVKR